MPIVKTKSKFDNSQCSLEKDSVRCPNTWKKDEEYLYDTEAKKAYCLKHDELNAKVVKSENKGGWKPSMPLCRPIDEAIGAIQKFNEVAVPMIRQQAKADMESSSGGTVLQRIDFWTQVYLENFLGKLRAK